MELFYQSWHPDGDPKAVLGILHGAGGHCGQYASVSEDLASRGYAVYGYDRRGHGRSEGPRGHIDTWDENLGDVRAFLQVMGSELPDQQVFLLGQSAGGLIVLDYALQDGEGLRGIVASGVPLEQEAVSPFMLAMARILSRVWPRFTINLQIDWTDVTRDPIEVKAREDDPLMFTTTTARAGSEFLDASDRVKGHPQDLSIPLLMNHGSEDRIAPIGGAQAFFQAVTYPDKEMQIYEGGYHDPFCDVNRDQVIADLLDWMERHL
jgi:alpha-beta hydrolase superfamily lysophospholipase